MNAVNEPSSGSELPDGKTLPEPSIGPACLVISMLMLATFCAVCGIGSWFMFSDQYPLAQRGIEEQLIPWIEQSELSPADKQSIVQQLHGVMPQIRDRSLSGQQLSRLRSCLQDNPVLLWGVLQSIQAQATIMVQDRQKAQADGAAQGDKDGGLTEVELTTLNKVVDRLLRSAAERKLGRAELEFAAQACSIVRKGEDSIRSKPDMTADNIRQFISRSEQLLKTQDVSSEPYQKTPAEAFEILLRAALDFEVK